MIKLNRNEKGCGDGKMDENKKMMIGVFCAVLIIMGVGYKLVEASVTGRADFDFETGNVTPAPADTVDQDVREYSEVVDNVTLEMTIPNRWNYEEIQKNEESGDYKHILKLYKNDEDNYAMLSFYDTSFGVCGTGRTTEDISLNNGVKATIGYYDGNEDWSDISFHDMNKTIVVINYGLTGPDAEEVIEIIKTMEVAEEVYE